MNGSGDDFVWKGFFEKKSPGLEVLGLQELVDE